MAAPPIIMESNVSMGWLLTLNARILSFFFLFVYCHEFVGFFFWKNDLEILS